MVVPHLRLLGLLWGKRYLRGGFKIFKFFIAYFVMEFCELRDGEWGIISVFLPPRRGRRSLSDDGSLIKGILYVVTTGCRWRWNARKYGIRNCWRRL